MAKSGDENVLPDYTVVYCQSSYNGNWLRSLRLKHGLHQHQLAAKLDVNQGRVSEWENGVKPIPPERLKEVETILN